MRSQRWQVIGWLVSLVAGVSTRAVAAPAPPFQVESFAVVTSGSAFPFGVLASKVNDSGQFVHLINGFGSVSYRSGSSTIGPGIAGDGLSNFAIAASGNCFGNQFDARTSTFRIGVTFNTGGQVAVKDSRKRKFAATDSFGRTVYITQPSTTSTGATIEYMTPLAEVTRALTDPQLSTFSTFERDDRGRIYIQRSRVLPEHAVPTTLFVLDISSPDGAVESSISLPSPGGGAEVMLQDVAPNGNMVAWAVPDTYHTYVYTNRAWTEIPADQGLQNVQALGITSTGIAVGFDFTAGDGTTTQTVTKPWLWFRGQKILLETLLGTQLPAGATLFSATGISDAGWIVGEIKLQDQSVRTYRLKINADSDLDGIPDIWEMPVAEGGGVFVDGDNVVDLDLNAMGARPDHKDLFVEVDSSPNAMISNAAADMVTRSFADAPLTNPDGTRGIRLHIIRDEAITDGLMPATGFAAAQGLGAGFPVEATSVFLEHFGSPQMRAKPNWDLVRPVWEGVARYCLAFNDIVRSNNTSKRAYVGLAESSGNQFVYSLQGALSFSGPSATEKVAASFMHELGHTLGLDHGGNDRLNYKPNYFSVMNYLLTTRRPFSKYFYRLDYSRASGESQNESSPNEVRGFAPNSNDPDSVVYAKYRMPYRDDTGVLRFAKPGMAPIDFNGDGSIEFFLPPRELNFFPKAPPLNEQIGVASLPILEEPLNSFDDWANVKLRVDTGGEFAALEAVDHSDYTPDLLNAIDDLPAACGGDFNGDDFLSFEDFDAFVSAFEAGSEAADFDGDGFLTFEDFDAFVSAFEAGC
jgi:hypothetical protein